MPSSNMDIQRSSGLCVNLYCSVLQIHPPPFATLAIVQIAGGLYAWDATFSLVITPSLLVLCPQLHVEDNAFDNFAVAISMEESYLHMWQSRVEIVGYSVTYFDHIAVLEAPYC